MYIGVLRACVSAHSAYAMTSEAREGPDPRELEMSKAIVGAGDQIASHRRSTKGLSG